MRKYFDRLKVCTSNELFNELNDNLKNKKRMFIIIANPETFTRPGEEIKLTTNDSKIPVYVIPTDEEVMMARDTYEFLK